MRGQFVFKMEGYLIHILSLLVYLFYLEPVGILKTDENVSGTRKRDASLYYEVYPS